VLVYELRKSGKIKKEGTFVSTASEKETQDMTPATASTKPAEGIAPYLLAACMWVDKAAKERQRKAAKKVARN
jgi:hypothetical protein